MPPAGGGGGGKGAAQPTDCRRPPEDKREACDGPPLSASGRDPRQRRRADRLSLELCECTSAVFSRSDLSQQPQESDADFKQTMGTRHRARDTFRRTPGRECGGASKRSKEQELKSCPSSYLSPVTPPPPCASASRRSSPLPAAPQLARSSPELQAPGESPPLGWGSMSPGRVLTRSPGPGDLLWSHRPRGSLSARWGRRRDAPGASLEDLGVSPSGTFPMGAAVG